MNAKRREQESSPILDIRNEEKTRSWNESISPRIAAVRGWFSQDEWVKGVRPYLLSTLSHMRENLEQRGNDSADDQFLKGQIDMLKQILVMPSVIEKQIALVEQNKQAGPRGEAGY